MKNTDNTSCFIFFEESWNISPDIDPDNLKKLINNYKSYF